MSIFFIVFCSVVMIGFCIAVISVGSDSQEEKDKAQEEFLKEWKKKKK